MKTKFFAVVCVAGLTSFSLVQAQTQPSGASAATTGSTNEEATNPEAPGGGHGLVWVNTDAGVYHREGSIFYGTTRKGKYMTEQQAIQAGYKRAPKGR